MSEIKDNIQNMQFTNSQGSFGDISSQKDSQDEELSTKTKNKIKSMVKILILPCLTYLYPDSPLKESAFQNPNNKRVLYLECLNCSKREERLETLPEIPEDLSNKLRLHIRQIMMKRSSSSNIQFNRSKKISNLKEDQVQSLDKLCIELISSINRNPESFENAKAIITELIHTIHSNSPSLNSILESMKSLSEENEKKM